MAGIAVSLAMSMLQARKAKKQGDKENRLAMQSEAIERDRQSRIDTSRSQINQIYDSAARQKQHADYAQALRDFYAEQLGRQREQASRQLKFATARSGLTGGSFNVDSQRNLGEDFERAAVGNERRTQSGVDSLRSQDEASRAQLLNLADAGMNATTSVRRASEAQAQDLGTALTTTMQGGLGDAFSNTAATYRAINERKALRKGFGYVANRGDLWSRA